MGDNGFVEELGFVLRKPVFYLNRVALRFELGGDLSVDEGRMRRTWSRAKALFRATMSPEDELMAVVYVEDETRDRRWVKRAKMQMQMWLGADRKEIRVARVPFRYAETDEELISKSYRLEVLSKTKQVSVSTLLKALTNREVGILPAAVGEWHLVNVTKRLLFHIYDERGLDIAAQEIEVLRPLYLSFHDWLLKYDLKKMNTLFT